MKRSIILFVVVFLISQSVFGQTQKKDKLILTKPDKGFYEAMIDTINEFNKKPDKPEKVMHVDLSDYECPKDISEFTQQWYNPPTSQGRTSTCWCYSTTSFLETEIYRLTGKKVHLSVMNTVYWEFVEKAMNYIQKRGDAVFPNGSEANAVIRIWKKYGCVPYDVYTGLKPNQKFHDHDKMYGEMKSYLENLKTSNAWNEEEAAATIKSILNHYMGVPPEKFTVDGKEYTPKEYLSDYLKINLDNYIDILSYEQQPYGQKVEYEVSDNWNHNKDYFNVPLDTFMKIIKNAVRNGYTMSIGGDISEPGIDSHKKVFMIPTFDIPSEYIDDDARQFRFSNNTTTDDHGIHLVGYKEINGKDWYLIKDSWVIAYDEEPQGYVFFNEDYVKLKMMDFMIHKDAVKGFIDLK